MPDDLRSLGRGLIQTGNDLQRAGKDAGRRTAQETRDYARRLSNGPFSLYTLALLDHPYATRHGGAMTGLGPGLLDASVINKQSGLFQRQWRVENLVLASGHVVYVVRNVAPYAKYLEDGTATMIARPMRPRLEFFAERAWERIAPPLIDAALRRSLAR